MDGTRRALSPTAASAPQAQSAVQPGPDTALPSPFPFAPAIADSKIPDSKTADYAARRLHRSGTPRSNHALPHRLFRDHMRYRSCRNFPRIHVHDVLPHRPRIHKRVVRNHRHTVVHALIHIRDVVGSLVDDHRVVNVRHLGDAHCRIGDVHFVHIPAAHAISRNKHFSRRQRKPAHTHSCRKMKSRAGAHKRHQRRRPYRTHHDRPRHPEPSTTCECPAPVVIRRKAPRLVSHPRPSPRANPPPIPDAIPRPTDNNHPRTPALALTPHAG